MSSGELPECSLSPDVRHARSDRSAVASERGGDERAEAAAAAEAAGEREREARAAGEREAGEREREPRAPRAALALRVRTGILGTRARLPFNSTETS
jgi:hypothetical protein